MFDTNSKFLVVRYSINFTTKVPTAWSSTIPHSKPSWNTETYRQTDGQQTDGLTDPCTQMHKQDTNGWMDRYM